MPKFKNVSGEALQVNALGERIVMPGETVDVTPESVWSEDNPTGLVWPDATWQPDSPTPYTPPSAPVPDPVKE